jgi:short-subunit dehydrogenase
MYRLQDKVAVITGAANGLGRALAKELHLQGCQLALLDIDLAGLDRLKAELQEDVRISIYKVDIGAENEVRGVQEQVSGQHQGIDILVNNAAIADGRTFDQVETDDYRRLFEVNFWGTVYCTKYFLPMLKKKAPGRLVNIIAEFAFMGFPGKTTYGSSKGAVMAFSNSLRTELAGTGISLSLVVPPPMKTEIVLSGKHADESRKLLEHQFLQKKGMTTERAAKIIVRQIKKGKYLIFAGPMMYWADAAVRFFPRLANYIVGRYRKKIKFV